MWQTGCTLDCVDRKKHSRGLKQQSSLISSALSVMGLGAGGRAPNVGVPQEQAHQAVPVSKVSSSLGREKGALNSSCYIFWHSDARNFYSLSIGQN